MVLVSFPPLLNCIPIKHKTDCVSLLSIGSFPEALSSSSYGLLYLVDLFIIK